MNSRIILSLPRNPAPRPIEELVERLNVAYHFLIDQYSETLGAGDHPTHVFLRDAVVEGFLLGIQWALGGRDELPRLMDAELDIPTSPFNNPGIFGRA